MMSFLGLSPPVSTVTDATRELIGAGGPGDRVDVTLAPEGGHSGTLWKEQCSQCTA